MVYRRALRRTGSGPADEPVVDATAFPPGDGGSGAGDDDAIGGGVGIRRRSVVACVSLAAAGSRELGAESTAKALEASNINS